MNREERMVDVGAVRLHVVFEGQGKPVVLLHGFPEFWYSWRHQMPALAAAGFRAVAPDQRGYNLSDKPRGRGQYGIASLVEDIVGLVRSLGEGPVHIVGHDWGGVVAWYLAGLHPELVDRLVILNSPHPRVMARRMRTAAQLKKSWYFFFFQLPLLPERMVLERSFLARALRGTSVGKRAAFSDEDLARYREAMAQPGAATGMINWYRAMRRRVSMPRVTRPTLVIWGERDRFLGSELLDGTERYVDDLRVHRIPGASHWVQHDCADEVNAQIVGFLKG